MASGAAIWTIRYTNPLMNTRFIRFGVAISLFFFLGSACHQGKRATTPVQREAAATPSPIHFRLSEQGLPTIGMWKCDPVMGDVNADGFWDIAALPRLGFGPRVWLGNASGTWTESSSGLKSDKRSCGGGLAFGDLNHDGFLDLAVADHCQGIFTFLGDGTGQWRLTTRELHPPVAQPGDAKYELYVGAEDLDVGDVNSDGNLDIVAIAQDEGGISLYLGDGTASNWTWTKTPLPGTGYGNRVILADVNADNHLDVVASLGVGPRVWLGDGAGQWKDASTGLPSPVIEGLFHGIDVGDINQDGRSDVAVANWVDGPEVYLQQVDGAWKKTSDVFPKMRGGAVGLALGDLDGDNRLDIVCSGRLTLDGGYVRGVFALLNQGASGWLNLANCGLPSTGLAAMGGVAIADLDKDGTPDIAAGSGLIVETTSGPSQPVVSQRLLVWFGSREAAERDAIKGE